MSDRLKQIEERSEPRMRASNTARLPRSLKIDYAREFDLIGSVQDLRGTEFLMQLTLVGACVAVAVYATGMWVLVGWYAGHYSLVAIERIMVSWRPLGTTRAGFFLSLFMSFLVGASYAILPVFLWQSGVDAFKFAAMALLVGSTLNTFLVRTAIWHQALCFVLPNIGAFYLIGMTYFPDQGLDAYGVAAMVIASAIAIYFGVAIREASQVHRRHDDTREQLVHSQKMEAIGSLTGGIAHDFNNILNVISGNLELLEREADPAAKQQLINQTRLATDRGGALTKQMLAFVRRSHLSPRRVAVFDVMVEIDHLATRLLPEIIAFSCESEGPLRAMEVDVANMQTALLNLIVNARDAMPHGGRITVRAQEIPLAAVPVTVELDSSAERFVRFTVTDNGVGIPPALVSRVIEPFFTTKPVGAGSGLGLSMVAGFVRQSGGGMRIDSREGQGTTVQLFLPATDLAPVEEIARPDPMAQVMAVARPNASVLVVEDEPQLLRILARSFSLVGMSVTEASSGDLARGLLERGLRPDLLVTDAVMPGVLQGPGLIHIARGMLPQIKCILVSGYDGASDPLNPEEISRGTVFLQKPVSLTELTRTANEMLGKSVPA